ncbi:DUF4124 domain-containing protein [Aeromonas schubertii]|uniref:DUF4124 domain-containing protein n=1 Tax=Aeromonas schubertii TaxID=652 RepID=A0ABS7VA65_9GAMM|nr:DUF4124 domain-containing protein [Aeromonas schubertii]KUE78545.1 hypothetical protein ATO46_09300 [Aeromonas schubertii]MBZ6065956.1 DUF4124 domain-containing protein [Aeromonas schubertii]MBZ6072714.1 DUF4124 domain-containing protein [Aeromonas schubertii]QCG49777.1 DUF4124 domain-containing protein [Aeromonas schubertii]
MRRLFWLLLLPLALQAAEPQIYTWTDANGVIHYSDSAPPGKQARPVDLEVTPSVGPSPNMVQVADYDRLTGKEQADKKKELQVALITPESGSTLRDNTGNVVFQAAITPQAPTQYELRLKLDGKAAGQVKNGLALRLENLDRGAHEAMVELVGENGTILAKSPVVTFYLHRAKVDNKPKPEPRAEGG